MTPQRYGHRLPQEGPFRIQRRFFWQTWLRSSLGFMLMLGLGGALVTYTFFLVAGLLETAAIWEQGTPAKALGYKGQVRTTQLFLKTYDLRIAYQTQEQKRLSTSVEFFRFFSGPTGGASYTIRYIPSTPKRATISWAYHARWHGWSFVWILVLSGALLLWAGVYWMRVGWFESWRLQQLAQKGMLVPGVIEHVEDAVDPNTEQPRRVYTFRLMDEACEEYVATSPEQEPLLTEEGDAIVVLLLSAEEEYHILRQDGFPLDIQG